MWDIVSPVTQDHDPIVYEGSRPQEALVINSGPGTFRIKAWHSLDSIEDEPQISVEVRPGDQRIVFGSLIRVAIEESSKSNPNFSAAGWRLVTPYIDPEYLRFRFRY
jgi:hypothetical protein